MEGKNKTEKKVDKPIPLWYKIFGVPIQDKIFFVQQLGLMLRSSISLSKALRTLSLQAGSKYMQLILHDLYIKVDQGQSFAESLKAFPDVFDELFVNMLKAGEKSGKYEEVLSQLHIQMKKSHELKSKIRGALIYPSVIVIAMISIGTAMMIFVIPKLTSIFNEVNVELPLATRMLIATSEALSENILTIGPAVLLLVGLIIVILKREKPKYYFHVILLKVPIFKTIIKKINIVRFSRTLGSLLKTDIPIIEALQLTSKVLGSRPYRKAIEAAAEHIKKGKTIESSLKNNPHLFPPVITQMVAVGEETGSLDTILEELSDFYDEEVSQTLDNLPSLIEPILLLVLGLAVGAMAVAIMMPLYSITEAI